MEATFSVEKKTKQKKVNYFESVLLFQTGDLVSSSAPRTFSSYIKRRKYWNTKRNGRN